VEFLEGSKADVTYGVIDVCFAPENRHCLHSPTSSVLCQNQKLAPIVYQPTLRTRILGSDTGGLRVLPDAILRRNS
jgi:hypothetical protein